MNFNCKTLLLALLLPIVFSTIAIKTRSKRQLQTVYICGGGQNQYISNYPCQNWGCLTGNGGCASGCFTGNCRYTPNTVVGNSYYDPYNNNNNINNNNCNTGCASVNCNNYYGQYVNGRYIAYSPVNNAYSACASSCCNRQQYLPLNNYNTPIGQGVSPNNNWPVIGQGAVPTNYHSCINGQCPTGYQCRDGQCVNLYNAPLLHCRTGDICDTGFKCGPGNLCYPSL
ncbi:unnamed protein product, partial [Mesorhabditis spiculigera]